MGAGRAPHHPASAARPAHYGVQRQGRRGQEGHRGRESNHAAPAEDQDAKAEGPEFLGAGPQRPAAHQGHDE